MLDRLHCFTLDTNFRLSHCKCAQSRPTLRTYGLWPTIASDAKFGHLVKMMTPSPSLTIESL